MPDTLEQTLQRLGQSAGLTLDLSRLPRDSSFQEIGLDSMALIHLMYAIEDELGLTLTTDEMLEINSISDMLQLIGQRQGQGQSQAAD